MDCYISLGANLGERKKSLRQALERLHEEPGIEVLRISGFFETDPWGKTDQPPFVNAAAKLRTDLSPRKLLERCQHIEKLMGRVRHEHWGARTIDIDLLHIPGISCHSEELHLPHPYMLERAFVLVPLAGIAPNLEISGKSIQEHGKACKDAGEVTPCSGSPSDFSLKLIACVDSHWGLGRKGKLLFHLPEDMAFFRRQTWGKTVIMGRHTMESIGKPLEGRRNLLLSHHALKREGFESLKSLEELWQALRTGEDAYVIGGGTVYRELLPYCREAFITHVTADGEADVFLRKPDGEFHRKEIRTSIDTATKHELAFCHYVRDSYGDDNEMTADRVIHTNTNEAGH